LPVWCRKDAPETTSEFSEAQRKMERIMQPGFDRYALRFVNIGEYEAMMESGKCNGEIFAPCLLDEDASLDFKDYLSNVTVDNTVPAAWGRIAYSQTNWGASTYNLNEAPKFLRMLRTAHQRARKKLEHPYKGKVRTAALACLKAELDKALSPYESGLQGASSALSASILRLSPNIIAKHTNHLAGFFGRDALIRVHELIDEAIRTCAEHEQDKYYYDINPFSEVIKAHIDPDKRQDAMKAITSLLRVRIRGFEHPRHCRETMDEFAIDEDFLTKPGNLRRLMMALLYASTTSSK
jgi:hypothetical protein